MKIEARGYANKVQVKTSKKGKTFTNFSLGVKQKDKAYGDKPETVTWAKLAVTDFSGTDIPEKSFVTVSGYLKVREFVDSNGAKRTSMDVNAESIEVSPSMDGSGSSQPKTTTAPTDVKDPWE